ncbi:MAG TPA: hypothetical protein VL156_15700 [Terriglobales bacterium]|nr:hypothetical protein [Terriglobales bacterium]
MSVVVIGGNSRSVGKTSVVAGIIAALPEFAWTALKITQFGHGICSANGKTCRCDTSQDACLPISRERDLSGNSDTSRFLAAGAVCSLWVRTRQGCLGEIMPEIRRRIAGSKNAIIESNSVIRWLHPDLYLTVLDTGIEDFKESAREFLERADGIILHRADKQLTWKAVAMNALPDKPIFPIIPPHYVTQEIAEWVREGLLRRTHTTAPTQVET